MVKSDAGPSVPTARSGFETTSARPERTGAGAVVDAMAEGEQTADYARLQAIYGRMTSVYFVVATIVLSIIGGLLLVGAIWELGVAVLEREVAGVLDSAGLVIIGFAIVETAKFFAEEEVQRERELRSAGESRRSLTKFMTILVIAASLEALVMIFEASRTDVTKTLYPAMLFAVAVFALVALGAYQWLSSRIAPEARREDVEVEAEDETSRAAAEAGD